MTDASDATRKVDLTEVRWGSVPWTMLVTLYLRAYESTSPASILADHVSAEAVDRIEYDFDRMRRKLRPASNQYLVALRASRLDGWARDYLERHPDAVVLHLGCGLDSRPFRLSLPPTVDWYDVDVPEVIEFRRRLFSDADHYRMLSSSVTEAEWLHSIPTGRPALILAEGLLPYLTEQQVRDLLARLTDRFTYGDPGAPGRGGELAFDALSPWIVRITPIQHFGMRDAHLLERWNPRLRLLSETKALAEAQRIPDPGKRRIFRLANATPGIGSMSRLLRYEIEG